MKQRIIHNKSGIFQPFWNQDQGPVEFGKKAFGSPKLEKFDEGGGDLFLIKIVRIGLCTKNNPGPITMYL